MLFSSGGCCHLDPLVKCICIYFILTCTSGLILAKNMALFFVVDLFVVKIVNISIDNNVLWDSQNAPRLFISFFSGEHVP